MITRYIYPLTLREKLTWKIKKIIPNVIDKNISISFSENLRFDLQKNDVGHQSIIFNGFYELELTKKIIELGKKGGTLVDVGANYGYFSCLFAEQNNANKVYAFEASPLNIEPLKNNIHKNNLADMISLIPLALGKENGKLNFNLSDENNQTGWGGFSIGVEKNLVEVDVITLDNYAFDNNIQKIDVLKIDTEGADTWVLYGAENLLKSKKIKNIFFENNLLRMNLLKITESEASEFLEKLDYKVVKQSDTDFYAYPN